MFKYIFPLLIIILIISVFAAGAWFLFGGETPEEKFLKEQGFLTKKGKFSKSPTLIEQNINSEDESFEVLATKLNKDNYQMAFKLENKSSEKRDFYLIPISKNNQVSFQEITGIVNNKNTISISEEGAAKEPLESLYNVEQHKKELNPELAKAYDDIDNNNYQAKPIKITLDAKSTLLAKSQWDIRDSKFEIRNSNLNPVYLLVCGSAGGAKDELKIIDVHSQPQKGDNWEVRFTTKGTNDLYIIPNDQQTIDDDEFRSLYCDNEKRTPQILEKDVIYYPNWQCSGIGRVIHYTLKTGNHTLRFEFGGQIAYAYNGWTVDGLSYNNRKKITIQNTNIDSDLTNFPVLIKIDGDTDIGVNTNADGHDIRFTSSDGSTLLKYERESHTVTSGSLTAHYWVKVPSLSATGTNEIYIYYRSEDTPDGEDAANVWDSNYVNVWHLSESFGSAIDSVGNDNGTFEGTLPNATTGKIFNGQYAEQNGDINFGADTAIEGLSQITISAWVKSVESQNVSGIDHIFTKEGWGTDTIAGLGWSQSDYFWFCIDTTSGSIAHSNIHQDLDNWHYVVGIYDGTNVTLSINGVDDTETTGSHTGSLANTGHTQYLGNSWNGWFDEVRISSIARSAAWIKFEYYNINEADNELTWGSEETTVNPHSLRFSGASTGGGGWTVDGLSYNNRKKITI